MADERAPFWHPMMHPAERKLRPPLRIVRGDGCYVYDDAGKRYVDGVAGLWNVNVGHNRKEMKAAIVDQLDQLEYFQVFNGISNPPTEALSARLASLLENEGMSRFVFGSNGSDATESALKLARQYWKVVGQKDRTKFISLKEGYHGSHFLGASVNGSMVYRRNYEPVLPGCIQVQNPWVYRNPFTHDPEALSTLCADLLAREIEYQGPDTVAAFIAEPVQGAGGVIVPPASYWPKIREVCDRYGVLLIADEVVTGFGRTGNLFGARGWGVKPDFMCFAKGISSGYIPLSATAISSKVAAAFEANGDISGLVMHGYTYSGHPLACSAALASLDITVNEDLPGNAARQGKVLLDALTPLVERYPTLGEVRGKGLMLALDFVADKGTRAQVDPHSGYPAAVAEVARQHGVLVRPVGPTIILSPPLVITGNEVDQIVSALKAGLDAVPVPA